MTDDVSGYDAIDYNAFRDGNQSLRLSWADGSAHGVIYNVGVPATSEAVLRLLPLTLSLIHAAWSGDMLMSARPIPLTATKWENRVRLVRPGDLTWDPNLREIAIAYGTAEARIPAGPHSLVVFGSLTGGLEELHAFGKSRRFKGLGEATLECDPVSSSLSLPSSGATNTVL